MTWWVAQETIQAFGLRRGEGGKTWGVTLVDVGRWQPSQPPGTAGTWQSFH